MRSIGALILGLSAVLMGCPAPTAEQSSGPAPGFARVSFTAPEEIVSSSSVAADAVGPAEMILSVNLSEDPPVFRSAPISGDANSIDLEKGDVHLLGLFTTETPDASATVTGNALGGAITLIGTINVVSVGLDALPLTDNAASEIDLGTGSYDSDNDTLEVDAGSEEVADAVGLDTLTLAGFGGFDDVTKKFLNPDIDRDGVLDSDQGLSWKLTSEYLFSYDDAAIDLDSGEVLLPPEEFFVPARKIIYFRAVSGFGTLTENLDAVRLVFPESLTVRDESLTVVTFVNPRLLQTDGEVYQFELTSIQDPVPFFDGDYRLIIDGAEYFFDRMAFANPANGYEGLIFPIFDWETSGSTFTTLRYRWKFVEGGVIRDARPAEIGLMVQSAGFEFVDTWPIFTYQVQDLTQVAGSIDVSSDSVSTSQFAAPGMSIRDRSGNQYQFWFDFQG